MEKAGQQRETVFGRVGVHLRDQVGRGHDHAGDAGPMRWQSPRRAALPAGLRSHTITGVSLPPALSSASSAQSTSSLP